MIWCSLSLISSHFSKWINKWLIDDSQANQPEPSASSKHSPEEEKHLEKHKLRLVSDLSHLNHCINRAPRGTLHSLMPFLVITRYSPGWGILLPHHLPSPLWPLPVSPSYKNLKSLKARCHFQSQPKPFRVSQSLQESSKAFQSHPKPSRVFQSLQESSKAFKSLPKPSRVSQSDPNSFLFYFIFIFIFIYILNLLLYIILSLFQLGDISTWIYLLLQLQLLRLQRMI